MKSQIFAVIDIGTLKIKSEVVSVAPDGTFTRIYSSITLTCFGVGLETNSGNPLPENLDKTIKELKRLKKEFKKHDVLKTKVVSTHVMRRLSDPEKIKKIILEKTGFSIQVLSEEQEAALFFKAVMTSFTDSTREYALVDVGGGSMQILTGTKNQLKNAYSIRTGTQILQERFVPDPAHMDEYFTTEKDIEETKRYIMDEILKLELPKNAPLIYGSSMILDVVRITQLPTKPHKESKTHPYKIYAEHMKKVMNHVLQYKFIDRDTLYPELPHRFTWGIDLGFLNVITLAERMNSPYIIPSNANIAQGLVYEMSEQERRVV